MRMNHVIVSLCMILLLVGCSASQAPSSLDDITVKNVPQLEEPQSGEEILIIDTSYGEVKIRLFPEHAPLAVEGIKEYVQEGYFDDKSFTRIESDFLMQVREVDKSESEEEPLYPAEVTKDLRHFTGAVGMAQLSNRVGEHEDNTMFNSFYIILPSELDEEYINTMKPALGDRITDEQVTAFDLLGGKPSLDGRYTVFGQVYEGLDILAKINEECRKAEASSEMKFLTVDIQTIAIEER